jgi:hypothetical protein
MKGVDASIQTADVYLLRNPPFAFLLRLKFALN